MVLRGIPMLLVLSLVEKKRVCVGKTFAETVAKIVVPAFISKLDFEFENPELNERKMILKVDMIEQPIIKMRVKARL